MSEVTIEAGTPEAIAFKLMQLILQHNGGDHSREGLLRLYSDCVATVRGPVAEDLMAALALES